MCRVVFYFVEQIFLISLDFLGPFLYQDKKGQLALKLPLYKKGPVVGTTIYPADTAKDTGPVGDTSSYIVVL